MIKRFKELPLGTRFRFKPDGEIYVVLDTFGEGLVTHYERHDYPRVLQSVLSVGTKEEIENMMVVLDEDNEGNVLS